MPAPTWSASFQRLVLVSALVGRLAPPLGAAIDPGWFGSGQPGSPATPRQRVAQAFARYRGQYPGAPGLAVMDHLVQEAQGALSAEEATAVQSGWLLVRSTAIPEDLGFVTAQIVEFMEYKRVE